MGHFEVAVATMHGTYDHFDHVTGIIDWVEEILEEKEMGCCELHFQPDPDEVLNEFPAEDGGPDTVLAPTVGMHVFDPKQEMREQLTQARALIEEARQLVITVHAALP